MREMTTGQTHQARTILSLSNRMFVMLFPFKTVFSSTGILCVGIHPFFLYVQFFCKASSTSPPPCTPLVLARGFATGNRNLTGWRRGVSALVIFTFILVGVLAHHLHKARRGTDAKSLSGYPASPDPASLGHLLRKGTTSPVWPFVLPPRTSVGIFTHLPFHFVGPSSLSLHYTRKYAERG